MSTNTIDSSPDEPYSQEESDAIILDLRDPDIWSTDEGKELDLMFNDLERMLRNAPHIGSQALKDSTFNINHPPDPDLPMEIFQSNPYHAHGSIDFR